MFSISKFAGASLPAQAEPARPLSQKRDYYARVSARFLKDPLISPDAKLLRTLLAAFADERTGRTFVSLARIERLMRCGRKRRSAAQNELVAAGWLQLERERAYGGRLGRLSFVMCEPPPLKPPVGRFATVVKRPSPNTSMPNR